MKVMSANDIANFVDDVQVQLIEEGMDEDTAAELGRKIENDLLWVQSRAAVKAARSTSARNEEERERLIQRPEDEADFIDDGARPTREPEFISEEEDENPNGVIR